MDKTQQTGLYSKKILYGAITGQAYGVFAYKFDMAPAALLSLGSFSITSTPYRTQPSKGTCFSIWHCCRIQYISVH